MHKENTVRIARKRPVQQRSRLTVAAILEATAQVLVQRGYEKATTGAVAERAGVGIGTLYQYFPNKELLVASVIDQHFKEALETIETVLQKHAETPLDVSLRAIIRGSLDAHRLRPELHKVLMEQVPRVGKAEQSLKLGERLSFLIQQHLARHLKRTPPDRLRILAFVLEGTVEALTHRAVIESPHWLSSGEMEEEAFALLAPYLERAVKEDLGYPAPTD